MEVARFFDVKLALAYKSVRPKYSPLQHIQHHPLNNKSHVKFRNAIRVCNFIPMSDVDDGYRGVPYMEVTVLSVGHQDKRYHSDRNVSSTWIII